MEEEEKMEEEEMKEKDEDDQNEEDKYLLQTLQGPSLISTIVELVT